MTVLQSESKRLSKLVGSKTAVKIETNFGVLVLSAEDVAEGDGLRSGSAGRHGCVGWRREERERECRGK